MDGRLAKRKSSPKVKTGCLTCKNRRVKCGEEKPSCHRCLKMGVDCDGYAIPASRLKKAQSPSHSRDLLPKSAVAALIPIAFAKSPFENAEEYRYFNLFCARTSFEIFPGFDSGSTRLMLLQSCHSDPAIRHALVAIGALDKTSETARDFRKLSVDTSEGIPGSNDHHRTALRQYTKAVSLMRASSLQMDLKTTLLSCLLILCFEAWNGNLNLAVQQVQTGIRLILEWKASSENPVMKSGNTSPGPNFVEDDLVQIFCRLAVQVCFFANDRSLDCRAIIRAEGTELMKTMPDTFSSLAQAEMYHQGILRRSMNFVSAHKADDKSKAAPSSELATEHRDLVRDFDRWLLAFGPLSLVHETLGVDCESQMEIRKAKVLALTMNGAYVSLATCLATDLLMHDQYNDHNLKVVQLAEEVLDDLPLPAKARATNFSFDSRLILPLWLVGLECRERRIRRKAIGLLLEWPRREGVWDTVFAAKMGQWVMAVEEKYLVGEHVPGWARVVAVKWTSDMEKRTAVLSCRQRRSAVSEEMIPRRKMISW